MSGRKLTQKGAILGKVTKIAYLARSDGQNYEFHHDFEEFPDLIVERSGKDLRIRGIDFRSSGIN